MQKKLLMSMSRRDNLPMAFYNPNREPQLIRSSSRKSSLSSARSSHRDTMSPGNFRTSNAFERSYEYRTKHKKRRGSLSARRKSKASYEDERDRSARLAADRNYGKKKFATKIPEKALRSTFNIEQERNHKAMIKSFQ